MEFQEPFESFWADEWQFAWCREESLVNVPSSCAAFIVIYFEDTFPFSEDSTEKSEFYACLLVFSRLYFRGLSGSQQN